MLEQFIENLSERFRSENDLSDVTWTMCQTSDRFQCVFLKFFFPWMKNDCGEVYIEREQSNDDSRPDFVFEYRGETYLIENKIGDKNHHFEQYVKRFNIQPRQLGYIANYPIAKEGFETHTWTEFYKYAKASMPEEEKELWTAFLNYLHNVCYIFIPTKAMDLNGMFSLYTFYRTLDDVISIDNEDFNSSLYSSLKDTNHGGNFLCEPRDGVMGKYFELKFKGVRINKSWGWIGVYFNRENPVICIGFCNRDGWGKPVNSLLFSRLDDISENEIRSAPYEEDGAIWFDFKKNDDFQKSSLECQIKLLREFFSDVILIIKEQKKNV